MIFLLNFSGEVLNILGVSLYPKLTTVLQPAFAMGEQSNGNFTF